MNELKLPDGVPALPEDCVYLGKGPLPGVVKGKIYGGLYYIEGQGERWAQSTMVTGRVPKCHYAAKRGSELHELWKKAGGGLPDPDTTKDREKGIEAQTPGWGCRIPDDPFFTIDQLQEMLQKVKLADPPMQSFMAMVPDEAYEAMQEMMERDQFRTLAVELAVAGVEPGMLGEYVDAILDAEEERFDG